MSGPQFAPLEPWPGPRDHASGLVPPQPSMIGPKGRHRDNPDLVEQFQLVSIALAYLMEDRGISQFVVPAERVNELRMSRVEVIPDEADRFFVKLES